MNDHAYGAFADELKKIAGSALRSRLALTFVPHPHFPTYEAHIGDELVGRVSLKGRSRMPTGMQIQGAEIEPKFRNMGLGHKIYGELMRRAPEQTLHSDGSVSPMASRLWQSLEGRKGISLMKNPGWLIPARGTGLSPTHDYEALSAARAAGTPVTPASAPFSATITRKAALPPDIEV